MLDVAIDNGKRLFTIRYVQMREIFQRDTLRLFYINVSCRSINFLTTNII